MDNANRKTIFTIARDNFNSIDATTRINALISQECIGVMTYPKYSMDGVEIHTNLFDFIDNFGFFGIKLINNTG